MLGLEQEGPVAVLSVGRSGVGSIGDALVADFGGASVGFRGKRVAVPVNVPEGNVEMRDVMVRCRVQTP